MSQRKNEVLTSEQEALLLETREKWRGIALDPQPIDRPSATSAIKSAYAAINKPAPYILFFASPDQALTNIFTESNIPVEKPLGYQLWLQLGQQLWTQLASQLSSQLKSQLVSQLESQLSSQLCLQFQRHLENQLNQQFVERLTEARLGNQRWQQVVNLIFQRQSGRELNCQIEQLKSLLAAGIQSELWACTSSWFDFGISVLGLEHDSSQWETFQSLTRYCGWIFPLEEVAIVCDRPTKLSFDEQKRLHAEGEPAIEFADGYSLYAYQGVTLPEKYGKLSPHQWQVQWLLQEKNPGLRQALIQGIGYTRLCQELPVKELDSWEEYTLLKIKQSVDVELVHLLKMVCPSTEDIHVVRVPPDINSAREAIKWVNWGTDSEEFSTQT
ncbi:MAG: hypothetical protein KME06_04405 [Kastovskya adunca ATA6-11-RM4]|jgi:hypothetical protein|nr:hypothetical protein [Kastovskya adunca ATA6-11-RM4]